MMQNYTPNKTLIVANNVRNHNEFVEVCKERLHEFLPVPEEKFNNRQPTQYIGGETRIWTETPNTQISLAFESVPWTHEDHYALFVMNNMIGSAAGFSSGGPGKGMYCRAIMNLMAWYSFVEVASGLNHHFTDSGLWGIQA